MPPQRARLTRLVGRGRAGRRHDRARPARLPPQPRPHGNDTPPPGVSLYHRPTLKELQARTTLHSPSPRLRGLAAWKTAATATLTSGNGYILRATPTTKGHLTYRVYKSADRDHAASASTKQTVNVT